MLLGAFAFLVGACARSGFPPGGPIDTIPPTILLTVPADSSLRVPRDQEVEITFSESVDRTSVQDGIKMYPPPPDLSFHWSKHRVRVNWEGTLAAGTTYHLLLSGNARDTHGVPMRRALHLRFSTGDSLDPGSIGGVLRAKILPNQNVPIALYPDSLGMRPDFGTVLPVYATETDTAGAYDFTAIHLGTYTLHALYDRNRDGYIDTTSDLAVTYPDAIRLTPERSVADSINLIAVDPQAPAVISGRIVGADSLARYRIEARPDSDSTFVVRRVERIGRGDYVLRVSAGRYRLSAVRMPGPGDVPPRLEVRLPDVIEVKPEEEYPGRNFEFPAETGAPSGAPGAPPERQE
jgi:Bacterial Ig-like domain